MIPLLALLGSAFTHPLGGACAKKSLNPIAMGFWAVVISTIPFIGELLQTQIWSDILLHWPVITLSVLFNAAYGILFVMILSRHEFQLTYPLTRMAPILIAIGEIIWLHQAFSSPQWIGIMTVAIGAIGLSIDKAIANVRKEIWLLTTCVVLCNAGIVFTAKYLLDYFTINQVWSFSIFEIFCYLVLVIIFSTPIKKEITKNFTPVFGRAFFNLLSWYLILYAMQYYPAAIASSVRNLSIVFGIFIGGKFFAEGHQLKRYIAGSLIVIGAAVALL